MSRSVNQVTLLGHLGKDCEVKYTPNGKAYGRFSVATSHRYKPANATEWQEKTTWHNIVFWSCENVAQYLVKGTPVFIQGRLDSRQYEKDGEKKYVTEVIAEELILLNRRENQTGRAEEPEPSDVPF